MIRNAIRCTAVASLAALAACGEKQLTVTNTNSPNTASVLATPSDLENFVGGYYKRWHTAMYGSLSNQEGMATVMSFEDFSTLSNNCLGQRVGIPRAANDNSIGNLCGTEQTRVYSIENEVERVASSVLAKFNDPAYTLGNPAQDARAKSFAQFLRGLSLGYLAMIYDSSAVVDENTATLDAGTLVGYPDVMAASMDALQKAIDFANASSAAGSQGFPLPTTWIPSTTTFTAAEYIKLIRSYRARFRANVARTPAERAAVNWDLVIADAQNGITADHDNITSTTAGPFNTWVSQFDGAGTWHQMTPFVIGMGDASGSYAAWTAAPIDKRGPDFLMVTPDQRFPQGATRAAQQADFAVSSCQAASLNCKRYYVNRPNGSDPGAQISWGGSEYDFARFHSWRISGDGSARNGKIVFFTLAELNLLEAEGQYRKGNYAAAAALINKTRARVPVFPAGNTNNPTVSGGGLPAITAFDATTPVPGGTDCVPKVPTSFTGPLVCGNMLEALKWEKRIETQYTHFAAWWLDSRGWGDLPVGTPLQWATPFADLQVRAKTVYSLGGGTNPSSAAKGTYGW